MHDIYNHISPTLRCGYTLFQEIRQVLSRSSFLSIPDIQRLKRKAIIPFIHAVDQTLNSTLLILTIQLPLYRGIAPGPVKVVRQFITPSAQCRPDKHLLWAVFSL